jgi:hypothetical protein
MWLVPSQADLPTGEETIMTIKLEAHLMRSPTPSRVHNFLRSQGWWSSHENLWTKGSDYYELEWSEALCIESLDFVEGMKR